MVPPGGKGDWLLYPARYDDFRAMPNHLPQRNRWYCYELMVRANTPLLNDGEVKWWVDGKLTADFPDLHIRSIPTLQIDAAKILLGANQTTQVVKKWYDNVVIAKQYIGPMVSPNPHPLHSDASNYSTLLAGRGNDRTDIVIYVAYSRRLLIAKSQGVETGVSKKLAGGAGAQT